MERCIPHPVICSDDNIRVYQLNNQATDFFCYSHYFYLYYTILNVIILDTLITQSFNVFCRLPYLLSLRCLIFGSSLFFQYLTTLSGALNITLDFTFLGMMSSIP
jgi:hypothetical protein